ncbi:MAG: crossover junction endodeoxyribonuclease RuvC [Parcubacteria group bacterium RIFCSPLOWO2_01_FULL_40_65]|nr:MAG: crossover junction endodeoxyribonuclease RuvC [Parcubacteria group bacterium RIFCSPHIGHO2_01_FULL_40_30]OHB19380.1 MAG: crossover junction endodeoxyribonuclease RuvC [Parcubacteria group bacterium RIFCSPHIGHO2_02_FULL_40_12]OHB21248.1 MAG: crossover junction endodeoxyribonuclease RuvC [Parcubacteria group bacterium RIFCSPLOWO2_01_FULL_40_65]OHB23560.1 MAG: crossover junction endodeoxyribonuclease RuvC [Parcubacteria group bacterium RIFCSPLOWO2_02_FULL_40_12]OHB24314.1 MAG: crossover jun
MIILGIDPGSTLIGYGAIKNEVSRLECLDYGAIRIKEKEDSLRLLAVKKSFEELLAKIKPELVVLEKLFFFKNRKTAIQVSQTKGVLILALAENKIPFIEVAPLELKKALTSYGRASKGSIQKMVKMILNLKEEPKPDDAADALALAILGCRG